jgi:hypothetical protein
VLLETPEEIVAEPKRKRKRRFLWLLTIPVFFLVLILSLQIHAVQTWAGHRLASYLSSEWNRKVKIEGVSIDLWARVVLNGLYIEDHKGDTLLYAKELHMATYSFSSSESRFESQSISLINPNIELKRYAGETEWNYQFLSDYFSSEEAPDTTSDFSMWVGRLNIENGKFVYFDYTLPLIEEGAFYEEQLAVSNFSTQVENFEMKGDVIQANIESLKFKERSGFHIEDLHAHFKMQGNAIQVSELDADLGESHLVGDLGMYAPNDAAWSDFNNKVNWDIHLKPTELVLNDLSVFSSDLKGFDNVLKLEGDISGPLNDLSLWNMNLEFGRNSHFKGNIHLLNAMNLDSLKYELAAESVVSTYSDLSQLKSYPFNAGNYMQLPANVSTLGKIQFEGNASGDLDAIDLYGKTTTDIGSLTTAVHMTDFDSLVSYSGQLQLEKFNLGTYYSDDQMGVVSANIRVDGIGIELANMDLNFEGDISELGLGGYVYTKMNSTGRFKNNFFSGKFEIADANAQAKFDGEIDFTQKQPLLNFELNINRFDLTAVGIIEDETPAVIAGEFNAHLKGLTLSEIEGEFVGANIVYLIDEKIRKLDYFTLDTEQEGTRSITLNSEVVYAKLEGNFNYNQLWPSLQDIIADALPNMTHSSRPHKVQDFSLTVRINDFEFISAAFIPELQIEKGTSLNFHVDEKNNELSGTFGSPNIQYEDYKAEDLVVDISRELNSIFLTVQVNEVLEGDSKMISNLSWDVQSLGDTVYSALMWGNPGEFLTGDLNGVFFLHSFDDFEYRVGRSSLVVNNEPWYWAPNASFTLCHKDLGINGFRMYNQSEYLGINGMISEHPSSPLKVELGNVDLSILNGLLGEDFKVEGEANGVVELSNVYDKTIITSELNLFELGLNDYEIGNLCVNSTWDSKKERLRADGEIERDSIQPLRFAGNYTPNDEENPLDFLITMNGFDLSLLNAFIGEDVLGIKGFASSMVSLTGTIDDPQLEGDLILRNAELFVPFLQTSYSFSDKVHIDPEMFAFDNVEIFDEEGNPGRLTGQVLHTNFSDWRYDVLVEMERPMLTMNTKEGDNSDFYGKAYTTGFLDISGYGDQTFFDMTLKSEKGTTFILPMSSSGELQFDSYISFVNPLDTTTKKELKADLSGITMNMQLDVTEDAEFQIIFDEAVGDVMKGRGKGHLSMIINNLSTFNMYGMLEITQGSYLFTLKNLLNKPFEVKPGGVIAWYGDPMAAELDMEAIYKASASLNDIIPDPSQATGKRVPVNLIMGLQGKMMNPTIGFDLELPQSDQLTQSRLASVVSTEQERNRQAFALLVMGRFISPPNITQSGGTGVGLASNGSELISSQISNWLSQISDDFDLGFNYRPGDKISNEEIEVALSTQLFNDRVSVTGNFGVARGNANTNQTTNYIGDVRVEYNITQDGKIRLMVYNESNDRRATSTAQSPYTQGIGVIYQEEFDNWKQLVDGIQEIFKRNASKSPAGPIP